MPFKRFAVISDIHGNADALAAVLRDIDTLRIETIVNLGDHLSSPLAARETAEMLMARNIVTIRGNHDRYLVEKPLVDLGAWDRAAHGQLDDNHLNWLRSLPPTAELAEGRIFACHGTPSSDTDYWMERVTESGDVVLQSRAAIEVEAEGISASLILCGHTHTPRNIRLGNGRLIVNPGSVGCPAFEDDVPVLHVVQNGNPNASYALIEESLSGWQVTQRSIAYDASRMIALAERAGDPDWVRVLRSGWYRAG